MASFHHRISPTLAIVIDDLEQSIDLSREELELQLDMKQMQLKSLLAITQAINKNDAIHQLFDMYKTFITWDLHLDHMVLLLRQGDTWTVGTSLHVHYRIHCDQLVDALAGIERMQTIPADIEDPVLRSFDVVIPVLHKKKPLSYTLLAVKESEERSLMKYQFIQTITNIITVAIENKRLFNEQLKQERVNRTMQLATEVQQMFMPDQLPSGLGYELNGIYEPHFSIGGDYYDVFQISEQRLLFCIADVSGKGVGAAMLMANFQAVLHSIIIRREVNDLARLITELNRSVFALTQADRFVTFFIAEVDTEARTISYVNAGHCPVLFTNEDQQHYWYADCPVLGADPKLTVEAPSLVRYNKPSIIMAYTDGLSDLMNEVEETFDEDRLWAFAYTHRSKSAEEFNHALKQRLDSFRGTMPYNDDVAVLTCRLLT